jgi:hypothetical protein
MEKKKKFAEASKDIEYSNGLNVHEFYTTEKPEIICDVASNHQSMNPSSCQKEREIKASGLKADLLHAINCFYALEVYAGAQKHRFKRVPVGSNDTGKDYYQLDLGSEKMKLKMKEAEKLASCLEKSLEKALLE